MATIDGISLLNKSNTTNTADPKKKVPADAQPLFEQTLSILKSMHNSQRASFKNINSRLKDISRDFQAWTRASRRTESARNRGVKIPNDPSVSSLREATSIEAITGIGFLLVLDSLNKIASLQEKTPRPSASQAFQSASASGVGGGLGGFLGGFAGSAISGFISSVSSPKPSRESQRHIASLTDQVIQSLTLEDIYDEILPVAKKGVAGYVKTWFLSQDTAMASDTLLRSVGESFIGIAKNVVLAIRGKELDSARDAKLQNIVKALIESLNASDFTQSEEAQNALKAGVLGYIKAYFLTQTTALASDTLTRSTAETLGSSIGGFLHNLASSLLGKEGVSVQDQKLKEIIYNLIATTQSDEFSQDPQIQSALKASISSYIKAYFNTQTLALREEGFSTGIGSSAANVVKGFVTEIRSSVANAAKGLFNTFTGRNSESNSEGMASFKKTIEDIINAPFSREELLSDTYIAEIQEARRQSALSYITTYFKAQAAAAEESMASIKASLIGDQVRSTRMIGNSLESLVWDNRDLFLYDRNYIRNLGLEGDIERQKRVAFSRTISNIFKGIVPEEGSSFSLNRQSLQPISDSLSQDIQEKIAINVDTVALSDSVGKVANAVEGIDQSLRSLSTSLQSLSQMKSESSPVIVSPSPTSTPYTFDLK